MPKPVQGLLIGLLMLVAAIAAVQVLSQALERRAEHEVSDPR